jgi:hypothetical protein
MRAKVENHLYLTEQEADILSRFFLTVIPLVNEDRLDMTELLGRISANDEIYDKHGQVIKIHYKD